MLFGLAFAGILINHVSTGYVPVINRGQRDIESNKSIAKALQSEREFFENHPSYRSKAQYCGTPFLARKLNMVCMLLFVNMDHSFITHGYHRSSCIISKTHCPRSNPRFRRPSQNINKSCFNWAILSTTIMPAWCSISSPSFATNSGLSLMATQTIFQALNCQEVHASALFSTSFIQMASKRLILLIKSRILIFECSFTTLR